MCSSYANTLLFKGNDCQIWAEDAAIFETINYGTMTNEEYDDAVGFYYEACEDAGGSIYMADPMFL